METLHIDGAMGGGGGATSLVLQTLPPPALPDSPSALRTSEVTTHLPTNAAVIRLLLPVTIAVDGPLGGRAKAHLRPGPVGGPTRTSCTSQASARAAKAPGSASR